MRLTVEDLRRRIDQAAVRGKNVIRRVTLGRSGDGTIWRMLGMIDGDGNQEAFESVEVFAGAGFASRPLDGANVEAVIVHVGAHENHPVVIATRDEAGRKAVLGVLEKGETAIYAPGGGYVKITKDGDIILRAKAGAEIQVDDGSGTLTAVALADHSHSVSGLTAGGDDVAGELGASDSNSTVLKVT